MALTADSISRKHRKDLAHLRRRNTFARITAILGLIVAVLVLVALWWESGSDETYSPQTYLARNSEWGRELVQRQHEYRDWMVRLTLPIEQRIFDSLSDVLFASALRIQGEREQLSFLTNLFVSLHFAALRVAFIVMACWKIWLLAILGAAYYSRDRWRAYRADDLLGQTGNNRVFYSGIRAALENLDSRGRPAAQVVGLACVPQVSDEDARKSGLGLVLSQYQALNATTLNLAAIILKFPHFPAYVADRQETAKLEYVFKKANLVENTTTLLAALLELHRTLGELQQPTETMRPAAPEGGWAVAEYAKVVAHAAYRVLSKSQRQVFKDAPVAQVATTILALEAGKVMAYGFEGEKWVRRSNFPQLSARAVLHSIPAFAREYDTEQRAIIRSALIYGSRRSVFAPVRLPRDMNPSARALRQWAELLLACPHELASTADEVELLSCITEVHARWEEKFYRGLSDQRPELCQGAYSTLSNLALFPLTTMVKLLRSTIGREEMQRLETLVQTVSQKQKLDAMAIDANISEGAPFSRAVREHVVAPISFQELKDLARDHNVNIDELKDWSTLRVVLQMFGWLARRVGDYTVPPSSLILSVLTPEERTAECNELGLIARRGMVPLRATRLVDRFGKQWSLKLERVARARMAVSNEQLEKLMRGAGDEVPQDELDSTQPISTGNPPRS